MNIGLFNGLETTARSEFKMKCRRIFPLALYDVLLLRLPYIYYLCPTILYSLRLIVPGFKNGWGVLRDKKATIVKE